MMGYNKKSLSTNEGASLIEGVRSEQVASVINKSVFPSL